MLNESKLIKEAYGRPEFNGRPPFELYKAPSEGKGKQVSIKCTNIIPVVANFTVAL